MSHLCNQANDQDVPSNNAQALLLVLSKEWVPAKAVEYLLAKVAAVDFLKRCCFATLFSQEETDPGECKLTKPLGDGSLVDCDVQSAVVPGQSLPFRW